MIADIVFRPEFVKKGFCKTSETMTLFRIIGMLLLQLHSAQLIGIVSPLSNEIPYLALATLATDAHWRHLINN
jgi:hypothetical protein